MENFNIEIDSQKIKEQYSFVLNKIIEESLSKEKENIESTIKTFFDRGFFKDKITGFEKALDWAIEACFREGVDKAMEELDFKELIAQKTKELLSNGTLIQELAEAKVRSSLGLPQKD